MVIVSNIKSHKIDLILACWRLILVVILAYLSTSYIFYQQASIFPKAYSLCFAISTVFIGYLLFPGHKLQRLYPGYAELIWCALLSFATFLVLSIVNPTIELPSQGNIAVAVFLLMFLLSSATGVLLKKNRENLLIPAYVLALFILFCTAPIWGISLLESIDASETAVNLLIALNPVSYLASMAEYDYLRSQWYYVNTPYGALRYSYLGSGWYTLIYIALTLSCFVLNVMNNTDKD